MPITPLSLGLVQEDKTISKLNKVMRDAAHGIEPIIAELAEESSLNMRRLMESSMTTNERHKQTQNPGGKNPKNSLFILNIFSNTPPVIHGLPLLMCETTR